MHLSENIRGAYNKIKHGGMCVRHSERLNPPSGNKVVTGNVLLINEIAKDGAIECTAFRVYGRNGIALAHKYFNNIRQITNESTKLANFVAYCLENNLMLPSQ